MKISSFTVCWPCLFKCETRAYYYYSRKKFNDTAMVCSKTREVFKALSLSAVLFHWDKELCMKKHIRLKTLKSLVDILQLAVCVANKSTLIMTALRQCL